MSLLDELRQMYGQQQPEDDPVQRMMQTQAPAPPPQMLDPQVTAATTADMSQPTQAPSPSGGHPDVLSFIKELDQSGRLTGGDKGPSAPKGMQAASTTVKSEQGGIPGDVRAQGVAVRGQAELDDAGIERDRRMKEADELEKRAAYLRQDVEVENEKRQQQEKENAARQERLRSQQQELAGQNDEPIDSNRYIHNMSIFQKGTALISAAIYGYLGGRGQAPITESLMQMAKEDTAAQMENNRAAQGKRSALIDQYERQYGDTTLVAKRLEADKLLTMSKEAKAQSMQAKSEESKAAAEDIAKKLQNRVGVLHQEIQEATFGKPVEVSTTYKPKGGGGMDMAAKLEKAAKLNKSLADSGASPEERKAMLKAAGLPTIDGQTMDEQKLAADTAEKKRKAEELSPEAQTDVRKRVDGLAEMVQGMDELDASVGFKRGADGEVTEADDKKLDDSIRSVAGQVGQSFSNSLPFGMSKGAGELMTKLSPEEVKTLERARDKIVFGQAKAEGAGALGDTERESYRQRIPTDSSLSVQRASAQVWRARKQQYNNLVGQYGKETVDAMLRERGIDPKKVGG